MREARRFLVSGRVQGVGFRVFAQDVARQEGLNGFVRNLEDGRVEVLAEGELDSLERFEAAMFRGPSQARVADVETEWLVPSGRQDGFWVR